MCVGFDGREFVVICHFITSGSTQWVLDYQCAVRLGLEIGADTWHRLPIARKVPKRLSRRCASVDCHRDSAPKYRRLHLAKPSVHAR